jgi:hypothetical protein
MANTTVLKKVVEPHVRRWLEEHYGKSFEEGEVTLPLISNGRHRFDGVSKDRTIVAAIKANATRENGKVGVGVIKSVLAELYFLSLVKANKKALVLTNERFFLLMRERLEGLILPNTEMLFCPLSGEARCAIAEINRACRQEIGKRGDGT